MNIQPIKSEEQAKMEALSRHLWDVTEFCLLADVNPAHLKGRPQRCFRNWDRGKLFNYVAFCHLTGRMLLFCPGGNVAAVGFAWRGWAEHIEARASQNIPQFCWTDQLKGGDSLFVAEVFGTRSSVRYLWLAAHIQFPDLEERKLYTFRHERLVRLEPKEVERFVYGRRS